MNYQDIYPVFVVKDLKAAKDFYTRWFNFDVYFESSFFLLMAGVAGEKSFSVGFIDEVHPSSPPDLAAMDGKSAVFLTLQVDNAQMEYDKLIKAGLTMRYHLKDEAWRQRRFGIIDPNGMYVDVVEQINPQEGFWEQYMQG